MAILTDEAVDALIKAGKLSPVTRTKLARVGMGLAFVRARRSRTSGQRRASSRRCSVRRRLPIPATARAARRSTR